MNSYKKSSIKSIFSINSFREKEQIKINKTFDEKNITSKNQQSIDINKSIIGNRRIKT